MYIELLTRCGNMANGMELLAKYVVPSEIMRFLANGANLSDGNGMNSELTTTALSRHGKSNAIWDELRFVLIIKLHSNPTLLSR